MSAFAFARGDKKKMYGGAAAVQRVFAGLSFLPKHPEPPLSCTDSDTITASASVVSAPRGQAPPAQLSDMFVMGIMAKDHSGVPRFMAAALIAILRAGV